MKVLLHCLLVVAVSFEGGRSAFAQSPPDKSGVRPSVISLPTGAGSIEGLGESFEPQLNTGGSSYGIAIAVVLTLCCAIGIGLIAGAFALPRVKEVRAERRCGKLHAFTLAKTPAFLSDDLARGKAMDALRLQGFDTSRWQLASYSQTKAPDGSADTFLCRNAADDNRGLITFTNSAGSTRHVDVRLSNSVVICIVRRQRRPIRD
jgi:hypothetical protein